MTSHDSGRFGTRRHADPDEVGFAPRITQVNLAVRSWIPGWGGSKTGWQRLRGQGLRPPALDPPGTAGPASGPGWAAVRQLRGHLNRNDGCPAADNAPADNFVLLQQAFHKVEDGSRACSCLATRFCLSCTGASGKPPGTCPEWSRVVGIHGSWGQVEPRRWRLARHPILRAGEIGYALDVPRLDTENTKEKRHKPL